MTSPPAAHWKAQHRESVSRSSPEISFFLFFTTKLFISFTRSFTFIDDFRRRLFSNPKFVGENRFFRILERNVSEIGNKPKEFKTCRCLQLFPGGVMYRVSSFDHSSHQFKEKENENPKKGRHSLRKACLTSLNVSLLLDKYQLIYVTNLTYLARYLEM